MEEPHNYPMTETYHSDASQQPHNLKAYDEEYSQGGFQNPNAAFNAPTQYQPPFPRTDSATSEAWNQRQQPAAAGALKRFGTRKVKLVQGSVLSVDYPVPSAIQNSVQKKYRDDLEGGSEEFTHMRCECSPEYGLFLR